MLLLRRKARLVPPSVRENPPRELQCAPSLRAGDIGCSVSGQPQHAHHTCVTQKKILTGKT